MGEPVLIGPLGAESKVAPIFIPVRPPAQVPAMSAPMTTAAAPPVATVAPAASSTSPVIRRPATSPARRPPMAEVWPIWSPSRAASSADMARQLAASPRTPGIFTLARTRFMLASMSMPADRGAVEVMLSTRRLPVAHITSR